MQYIDYISASANRLERQKQIAERFKVEPVDMRNPNLWMHNIARPVGNRRKEATELLWVLVAFIACPLVYWAIMKWGTGN